MRDKEIIIRSMMVAVGVLLSVVVITGIVLVLFGAR